MALIVCPECKKEISDTATACPACGYKLKKKRSIGKYIAIIVAIAMIAVVIVIGMRNCTSVNKDVDVIDDAQNDVLEEQEPISAIESLNEDEKIIFDTIIKNSEMWKDPRSIRVLSVPNYKYVPDADPKETFAADFFIAKLEGGNSLGGTITAWYLFSLSNRGCAYSIEMNLDQHIRVMKSVDYDAGKRVSDTVAKLCFKGEEGAVEEIVDYDAFKEVITVTAIPHSIDTKKINNALEEYWD